MAAAFAEGAVEGTTKDTKYTKGAGEGTAEHTEDTEALANARGGDPENRGRFSKTEGPQGRPREPETKGKHDRYGVSDEEMLSRAPGDNADRGRAALDDVIRRKSGYVDKAMYREETGWIRFDWGDPGDPNPDAKGTTHKGGHGLSHIAAKHEKDMPLLPEVLARGDVYRHERPEKFYVVHGGMYAIVEKQGKGHTRVVTEFTPDRPQEIERIMKRPRARKPGA